MVQTHTPVSATPDGGSSLGGAISPPDSTSKKRDGSGHVQSVARAVSILRALGEAGEGMTLTDVSLTVGLPPSTTHRLLTTLQNDRMVRFDQASTLWHVGVSAFVIGNAFVRSRDLVLMARPAMRRLMEDSGETVKLAVADGGEIIYLAQVESLETMRASRAPGTRVPMHCSGVGKALLAAEDPEMVQRFLETVSLRRVTPNTLDSRDKFQADLDGARTRGFAIDDEEHAVGLRCVAAVIRDEHGEPMGAISISGPTARISRERVDPLGSMVMQTARIIGAELGGQS